MSIYKFISFSKKISAKGNSYAKLSFVDEQFGVIDTFIYEPLISVFESLIIKFGDLVEIDVDLRGVKSFRKVVSE